MIKQVPGLVIGDFGAATIVNDHGVVYIGFGTLTAEEELMGIDEIEARALHEWLGLALPSQAKSEVRHD